MYQEQKIPYYLIINVDDYIVEVYKIAQSNTCERVLFDAGNPCEFQFPGCRFALRFEDIWN